MSPSLQSCVCPSSPHLRTCAVLICLSEPSQYHLHPDVTIVSVSVSVSVISFNLITMSHHLYGSIIPMSPSSVYLCHHNVALVHNVTLVRASELPQCHPVLKSHDPHCWWQSFTRHVSVDCCCNLWFSWSVYVSTFLWQVGLFRMTDSTPPHESCVTWPVTCHMTMQTTYMSCPRLSHAWLRVLFHMTSSVSYDLMFCMTGSIRHDSFYSTWLVLFYWSDQLHVTWLVMCHMMACVFRITGSVLCN